MSEDGCHNDCVLPLHFPRRPGEHPPSAHGEGCFCCMPETRISSDNRPALPHFNYRIGTYGTIREWLFHQINQTPALQHWTHRTPDDPAIALLEGASILGDILTFYQETYANEAFLRTAQWRESISDLVRLLGYRLSPAIGGNATFAFEIKKNEPVIIPAGFPVKATLEQRPTPAEFETQSEITAYPWLSRFNLFRPLADGDITPTTTEFYITYPEQLLQPIDLKVGDRLLVGDPDLAAIFGAASLPNAEIVIVDSISELHGRKTYKIKGNLKRTTTIGAFYAYRLGRSFHHLGHNGPAQIVDQSKPVTSTTKTTAETNSSPAKTETSATIPHLNVPLARPIKTDTGTFSDPAINPSIRDVEFPLDMEVRDIPNNVAMIIQARIAYPGQTDIATFSEFKTLIRTIKKIDPIAMTWGGTSGAVSKVTVSGPISDSIGDGDPTLAALANADADDANELAAQALADAAAARDAARLAKKTAENDAAFAAAADADVLAKTAEAAAAESKAATLAVAAAVAASALKDGPTDAAAQTAVVKAQEALAAANRAQGSTNTAAADAADAAQKARDAKTHTDQAEGAAIALAAYMATPPGLVHAADLFLDGFIVAVDGFAIANVAFVDASKSAAEVTKRDVDTAKTDVDDAQVKAAASKVAVDAVAAAAAADADAKERSIAADSAAVLAQSAATTAANKVVTAKGVAAQAHADAILSQLTADGLEMDANDLEALAAIAVEIAAIKEAAKVTRMYIGNALFHEVTTPLFTLLRAKKETTTTSGNQLNFFGTADEVKTLKDRRIMLEKHGTEARMLRVTNINSVSAVGTEAIRQLHEVTLAENVSYADFANERALVTVFGNVVDADEGKTLPEAVLGSGDATKVFQNFKIPKAPLTYHLVREHTPSETPEVDIYVDGRQWEKVDSFFGRGAQEPVYIVREDAGGHSWAQFGDGKTGARLTNGINNVTAIFRVGASAYGPLKADTKVQAAATLKNLDKIQMPMAVSGGSEPEDGENARHAAPGKVQSLGRIVSLKDFEAEAAAIPGVSRAAAAWQLVENTPAVVVTVLMETGRSAEIRAVGDILRGYNTSRGAGRFSVQVVGGKRKYVTVSIQYALKPGFRADLVEPAIRMALGVHFGLAAGEEDQTGLFSLRQRRFSEREYASSIEGVTQNVEGVLWARTVAFEALTDESAIAYVDDPKTLALPLTTVLEPIVPCETGFLLSLYAKHLLLTAVTAEGR